MKIKQAFQNIKGIGNVLFYLIRTSWRYDKTYLLLYFPQIVVMSLSPFVMVIFPRLIINALTSADSFRTILLLVIFMFVLRLLFSFSSSLFEQKSSQKLMKIKSHMKLALMRQTMSIEYPCLEDSSILDLRNRASQCVDDQYDIAGVANALSAFLSSVITIIGLITIVTSLNPFIFPLILLIVIVNSWANARQAEKSYFFRKSFSHIARRLFYIIGVTWDSRYAKEIRVFSLKDWLSQKKQKYLEQTSKNSIRIFFLSTMTGLLSNTTMAIQQCLIYLYLAYKVIQKAISIGDFTMYLTAVNNFSDCLKIIMNTYTSLKEISLYVSDYQKYMALGTKAVENDPGSSMISPPQIIEFDHIYFRYPHQEKYAVENLNFSIRQGETLSIVGENGAGKSTIIKLLMRLYQPEKGVIKMDGRDIRSIPFEKYTRLLSTVFQDYKTFAFSVAENIGYDHVESQRLHEVLVKMGLQDKIAHLKDRENTFMTRQYSDTGIEFSGGEQQKIAIASALYKDSPIIILDEPTANLSPIAEYELYQQFHQLTQGKTVLYISHRMSSCRFCDNILVMDAGKLIEYGNHRDLMRQKGVYYRMFQIQAQYYT